MLWQRNRLTNKTELRMVETGACGEAIEFASWTAESEKVKFSFDIDDDAEFEMATFFDEENGEFLSIQRATKFDDQDVELGMDTYCLTLRSGQTHYGGILKWTESLGLVNLHLSETCAAQLGLPAELEFEVDQKDSLQVRAALSRLSLTLPS